MATRRQRLSLLPLLTVIGPMMACSGSNSSETTPGGGSGENSSGSTPAPTGGSSSSGGTSTPAPGSTTGSGSGAATPPSSSGGSGAPGGTSSGTQTTPAGSGSGSGGATPGGPGPGTGSSSSGAASGSSGSGVAPGSSGGADGGAGSASSGGTPIVSNFDGGIPSGYPAPTAAEYQKCTTVPVGATACAGQATTDVCIECLFGGSTYNNAQTPDALGTSEAGNYIVTVQVGGAAAGSTYISAESERGLLAPVTTAAGQSSEYAFVVNVRAMEGQPNHAGGPGGYPGLDLFFSGPMATPPQVSAIGWELFTAATKPIMIYMASDST